MKLIVQSIDEIDEHLSVVHSAAARTQAWIANHRGKDIDLLRSLKFDAIGIHPVSDHALNAIEQINQTFTYIVALSSARELLTRHPDAGGFVLAPGAHMSQALDIMSVKEGLVGAETFAAVDPKNNGKLAKDIEKLASRAEKHRYVFFASPKFPGVQRLPQFEREGIEVWSVDA